MALKARPPVVTIMGHVDHGKTTLLDYIRKTNVTAGEAGGITQHIGAYSIDFKGKPITFIDTPGHAAFSKMRERGSEVTDLIVLVVAANDGVKPQTVESIRHIKNSGVPYIVAINKMDLKDTDTNLAKAGLAEHGVVVSDYGGDIEVIEISALKGKNVDKLLETLVVMAELQELKADPDAPLEAVVIESAKTQFRGPVATVIVKQGTLQTRMDVTAGGVLGRVKQLLDEAGTPLEKVEPGFPAEIMSFEEAPPVGSIVQDINAEYAEPEEVEADEEAEDSPWGDLDFDQLIAQEDKPKLNMIVKADVKGTLEAILQNFDDESTTLISTGLGEITEKDLDMAETSKSLIIAFNVKIPGRIKRMAKDRGIKIKRYDIIYQLIEDLQKQMLKLLEPTIDETVVGEAEIQEIFEIRNEKIAGVRVKTGEIKKTDKVHLKREDEIILDPTIKGMMHGKQEVDSIKAKGEGGISFRNKRLDLQVGDILIAYTVADDDEF